MTVLTEMAKHIGDEHLCSKEAGLDGPSEISGETAGTPQDKTLSEQMIVNFEAQMESIFGPNTGYIVFNKRTQGRFNLYLAKTGDLIADSKIVTKLYGSNGNKSVGDVMSNLQDNSYTGVLTQKRRHKASGLDCSVVIGSITSIEGNDQLAVSKAHLLAVALAQGLDKEVAVGRT